MMYNYYVNKNPQKNGDHEVHREDCKWLPAAVNRIYLGRFSSCRPAVIQARNFFTQVNGCKHCSWECHTS